MRLLKDQLETSGCLCPVWLHAHEIERQYSMHLHVYFPTHLFARMICDFAFTLNTSFIFNSEELAWNQLGAIPIEHSVFAGVWNHLPPSNWVWLDGILFWEKLFSIHLFAFFVHKSSFFWVGMPMPGLLTHRWLDKSMLIFRKCWLTVIQYGRNQTGFCHIS